MLTEVDFESELASDVYVVDHVNPCPTTGDVSKAMLG